MNWEQNSPDSLTEICCVFCLKYPETFCDVNQNGAVYKLRENVTLPKEICEKLLKMHSESTGNVLDDRFINIFQDTINTRLKSAHIPNSDISDQGLKIIFKQKINELNIEGCTRLTESSLQTVNTEGTHLLKLSFGSLSKIFPESTDSLLPNQTDECNESGTSGRTYSDQGYILHAPYLKHLKINYLCVPLQHYEYFPLLLDPLKNLSHLDLSGCYHLGTLESICSMSHLTSLVLYNVPYVQKTVPSICKVKTLRHLDLSQCVLKVGEYTRPNSVLKQICTSLPLLQSLDISGTNLAGTGVADLFDEENSPEKHYTEEVAQTDIPGLASRVSNPLNFLGLLETSNDACHRHHIPARHVSGSATEAQVLTAASVYCERSEFLKRALNELFRIFRYEMCQDQRTALRLILKGMSNHVKDKHIQISGSASLFYIVKGETGKYLNCKVRKEIVKALLDAMTEHKYETTMIRNGCLTLCHFRIPQDVLFEYERLVRILLHIVAEDEQDEFIQRIGIYLLNSLACQVDGHQKQLVGDLGAIQTMLKLIEERLFRSLCDDVMEIAWSAMWNVTDETPVNCERFLDGGGMELFLRCLREFPLKPELLRNMMGLLGNVAEVKYLRPRLMKEEFLAVFSELLDNRGDGIEVSYNAAGILSHIGSDGPELWTELNITSPSREVVLARLQAAVNRWNINATRNINYRSFEPILRLVKCECCPEAQYWAVWALANLTCLYPNKYCELIEEEGGIEIILELQQRSTPFLCTKDLARRVIDNCERYAVYTRFEEHADLEVS